MITRDLSEVINRVYRKDSYYWAFRHTKGLDRSRDHEVEVRIDLPVDAIAAVKAVAGWKIVHVNEADGMLFMRRFQPLSDNKVRAMFIEVVTFAFNRSGRFHSWMHKPDLTEWQDLHTAANSSPVAEGRNDPRGSVINAYQTSHDPFSALYQELAQ